MLQKKQRRLAGRRHESRETPRARRERNTTTRRAAEMIHVERARVRSD